MPRAVTKDSIVTSVSDIARKIEQIDEIDLVKVCPFIHGKKFVALCSRQTHNGYGGWGVSERSVQRLQEQFSSRVKFEFL